MEKIKATLILDDGSQYEGYSFGYQGGSAGELVFNTAMTGYPESLTDPSYKGQILVATYPLIGNYGVPGNSSREEIFQFWESDAIQVSGLVVSEYSERYSHWNAKVSLGEWLKEWKIPAISGIDTRALTKKLREKGSTLAKIVIDADVPWRNPDTEDLVAQVSTQEIKTYGSGKYRIALVDCGVKNNILRCLLRRDTTVVRLPHNHNFNRDEWDGLFISNGPGDPKMNISTIENLRVALDGSKPIMGICLGTQLMALATGANTYKLPYGHRSHNQPVILSGTNRCYITSQNHGFAIDTATLNKDWSLLFENANDGTCEGIKHSTKPFFAVQFHPEASGGPTDTEFLFDDFLQEVAKHANK
ncbi:MAG TPA: glutamine-hydrolyzing carbamoyl-phosphate synthase small subunit [Williamwhitmania sp.]|nr:glutamine-hydrolyzing carbamoyl-phosphate synthase small subunit [Williamwhitmania sp.]